MEPQEIVEDDPVVAKSAMVLSVARVLSWTFETCLEIRLAGNSRPEGRKAATKALRSPRLGGNQALYSTLSEILPAARRSKQILASAEGEAEGPSSAFQSIAA